MFKRSYKAQNRYHDNWGDSWAGNRAQEIREIIDNCALNRYPGQTYLYFLSERLRYFCYGC